MDVIEYELPDDSESDDVSSASSGTDVSCARFETRNRPNGPIPLCRILLSKRQLLLAMNLML